MALNPIRKRVTFVGRLLVSSACDDQSYDEGQCATDKNRVAFLDERARAIHFGIEGSVDDPA